MKAEVTNIKYWITDSDVLEHVKELSDFYGEVSMDELEVDDIRNNIIETLPTNMTIDIPEDLFNQDEYIDENAIFDDIILDLVSDETGFLIDSLDYTLFD